MFILIYLAYLFWNTTCDSTVHIPKTKKKIILIIWNRNQNKLNSWIN